MKGIKTLITTLAVCGFVATGFVVAQPQMDNSNGSYGCGGMEGQHPHLFDPSTVEMDRGEIIAIDTVAHMGTGHMGTEHMGTEHMGTEHMGTGHMGTGQMSSRSGSVYLRLATEREEISVHLAPAWYLASQDLQLELGDQIEVVGSRLTNADTPTLIATQIRRDRDVLNLRNEDGVPIWHRCQR